MPHVSRHSPIKKISDKTLDLFMECVTAKWSKEERRAFFDDLLTPTERIMFSKRLAVLYMLAKGYSFDVIQETLRVSPSTIARLWDGIQKGKYAQVIRHLHKQSEHEPDLVQWFSLLVPPMQISKKQYIERMRRLNL